MKDTRHPLGIRRGLHTKSQTQRFLKINLFTFTIFEGLRWKYVSTNERVLNRADSGGLSVLEGSFWLQWIKNFLERRNEIWSKAVAVFRNESGDIYPVFPMIFHFCDTQALRCYQWTQNAEFRKCSSGRLVTTTNIPTSTQNDEHSANKL